MPDFAAIDIIKYVVQNVLWGTSERRTNKTTGINLTKLGLFCNDPNSAIGSARVTFVGFCYQGVATMRWALHDAWEPPQGSPQLHEESDTMSRRCNFSFGVFVWALVVVLGGVECWFDPVDGYALLLATDADIEELAASVDDLVRSLVRLLQRPLDVVNSNEHKVASGQVLRHKYLGLCVVATANRCELLESLLKRTDELRAVHFPSRRRFEKLTRQLQRLTVHHFGRRAFHVLPEGRSKPQEDQRKFVAPVFRVHTHDNSFHRPVEALDHAVRLRVIRCCPNAFNSQELAQFPEQFGFELSSLIGCYGFRNVLQKDYFYIKTT